MSKLIVLLMDQSYPFLTDVYAEQRTSILVRQTLRTPRENKTSILSKANFVKNLKNKYLVKVESLLEEEDTIHVMYEYVENKLQNVLKDASTLMLNKINAQLNEFGRYLSNIGVRILFSLDRMGFNNKENFKYFMGLDFDWEEDPDEEFLEQFYDKQIVEIMGHYMKKRQLLLASPRKQSTSIMSKQIEPLIKQRKISYSTLPNRYSRFHKIDEKLKQIKSSTKINNHVVEHRKPNSVDTVKYTSNFLKKQPGFPKKAENRKYSSDIKYGFSSKDKLEEKESDIQSQYWQRKKKIQNKMKQCEPQFKSEADTNKTKSRTQQMKQKQYRQISNMKKDYLKDFISVLEEEEEHGILPVQSNRNTEEKIQDYKRTNSFFAECNEDSTSTEKLQMLAKEAIAHSLKVISKFKNIIRDS